MSGGEGYEEAPGGDEEAGRSRGPGRYEESEGSGERFALVPGLDEHGELDDHDGYNDYDGYNDDDRDDRYHPDYRAYRDPGDPAPRRRRSVRVLGFGTAVAVLAAGTYLAFAKSGYGAPGDTSAGSATSGGGSLTGAAPSSASAQDTAAVQTTAQAFLTAWQSGNDAAAAALTDSPRQAEAALDAYRSDLHVSPMTTQLTGTDTSGDVTFTVAATVHLRAGSAGPGSAAADGTWNYSSQLSVGETGGKWLVQWQPAILAANMTSDTHLMLTAMPASDAGSPTVTDDHGDDLADSSESALQKIAAQLSQSGPGGTGTPGIDVEVVDASNTPLDDVPAAVVASPGSAVLATTIDAKVQQAASAAVQKNQNSSMVVLQPTTGHILAIANNDGGLDNAMIAGIAPGSTMKVVTSTAMLNQGMSMDSDVACPASLDVDGAVTHNSGGESRPADTPLIDDFAASCNNAFAEQYQLLSGDLLARTAQSYFGLNEPWDIGLGQPTAYFTMPTGQSDAEVAAEAFGQGRLEASPLAMASVAATVDTGSFHQPVILAGARQVSATPLPSGTDGQLKQMMRAVVGYSDGTAHGVGFGSGVYAKTGTAEDQAGYQPNSWIIVYDPSLNIAIGCVVLQAGAGNQYAGPEALSVIEALS